MKTLTKFAVAVAALMAATPAVATQSRINSMAGGEKAITVRDEANIHAGLPQFLVDHGNEVDVDAASGGVYGRMNVRYALTDDAVLLLYGLRSPWASVVSGTTINGGPKGSAPAIAGVAPGQLSAADPTNHQFGVGFGTKVGDGMRLGARIDIGGARDDADGNNLNNNTLFGLNFGLGFDIGETNSLDFGLKLRFGSFTDFEAGADRWLSNANIGFGLLTKGEFQVHPVAKLVPYLTIDYLDVEIGHAVRGGAEQGSLAEAKKGSVADFQISLGADLAISPADRVIIQPGLGLGFRSSNAEGTDQNGGAILGIENSNQIAPYYGFAAEAQAFDWLALRVGARQTIVMHNSANTKPVTPGANDTNEFHKSSVVNTLTTGFGISVRGWQLDLNVNPLFFNNNFFAVSGVATPAYAFDFAMVYDW